jgi:hypothetical protein
MPDAAVDDGMKVYFDPTEREFLDELDREPPPKEWEPKDWRK